MLASHSVRLTLVALLFSAVGASTRAQGSTASGDNAPPAPRQEGTPIHLPQNAVTRPNPEGMARAKAVNEEIAVFMRPAEEMYKAGNLAGAEKACLQAIAIREKFYNEYNPGSIDYFGRKFSCCPKSVES